MHRVGRDDVEPFARGQQPVATVVERDLEPRIIQYVVVPFGERARRRHHGRFELRQEDALGLRME
jgi:hypothetical protein